VSQHVERAFENAVEDHLFKHGWRKGDWKEFDSSAALDANEALAFISESQPDLWFDLRKQHGASLEKSVIDWLVKALDSQGTLDVLRNGFKFFGKPIRVAYFRPGHGMNPELVANYAKNRLTVTRQVRFDPASEQSIDLVLLVNGLPVTTAELKNPLTGQTVSDAIAQYGGREPKLPLFQFRKRALVHFAVDPHLVYMTTRLAGKQTVFLPFNLGFNKGAGNPPSSNGYETAYLWERVWQRDSLLDILARFVHVEKTEKQISGKLVTSELVIFPRYHQLDVVRLLEAAAQEEGPGHNYLIEHSAGSGKSNSIAWLAYRLSELHRNDEKVYHSVVVVTDRLVLDKQLQDTIYQFEHKMGVVDRIDEHSDQLAEALIKGTPIIITTLWKFPFVADKIGNLPNRNYAVIVDEAHSSQGGESASQMKDILRAKNLDEAGKQDSQEHKDSEDRLREMMESRGPQKNMSFFAFTATPKAKTLEVFGRRNGEGKPEPFHLYSMRQAIEEQFILDVLENYTTYKTYWKLLKKAADDPRVPKRETAAQLARFVSLHPHNIAQKTEVIIEHFRQNVRHRIGGKAKAMLVTASRLHAVRYKIAFEKYIAEKCYADVGVLVAFSGEVCDPDVMDHSFTEPGMNKGIREERTAEPVRVGRFQCSDRREQVSDRL
jgi:type I restriction enzyme, R subunit